MGQSTLRALADAQDTITSRLHPASLSAFNDGELSFSIDDVPVVERIFVESAEGEFIVAQWKVLASTFSITEKTDGKKLSNALRKVAVADNAAIVQQVIALEGELAALETDILAKEAEMETTIYRLYGVTEAERKLINSDR